MTHKMSPSTSLFRLLNGKSINNSVGNRRRNSHKSLAANEHEEEKEEEAHFREALAMETILYFNCFHLLSLWI